MNVGKCRAADCIRHLSDSLYAGKAMHGRANHSRLSLLLVHARKGQTLHTCMQSPRCSGNTAKSRQTPNGTKKKVTNTRRAAPPPPKHCTSLVRG